MFIIIKFFSLLTQSHLLNHFNSHFGEPCPEICSCLTYLSTSPIATKGKQNSGWVSQPKIQTKTNSWTLFSNKTWTLFSNKDSTTKQKFLTSIPIMSLSKNPQKENWMPVSQNHEQIKNETNLYLHRCLLPFHKLACSTMQKRFFSWNKIFFLISIHNFSTERS